MHSKIIKKLRDLNNGNKGLWINNLTLKKSMEVGDVVNSISFKLLRNSQKKHDEGTMQKILNYGIDWFIKYYENANKNEKETIALEYLYENEEKNSIKNIIHSQNDILINKSNFFDD